MDYEINKDTFAIIPLDETKSKVIEKENEYIINSNPYKIMEHSCEYFGSSLEGRFSGTKNMLGSIYKPPIFVEESRKIIFFPTTSPRQISNIWLSLNNLVSYEKLDENKTIVYFSNNKKIVLNIPYLSMDNQVLRATRLEAIHNRRKNEIKSEKIL